MNRVEAGLQQAGDLHGRDNAVVRYVLNESIRKTVGNGVTEIPHHIDLERQRLLAEINGFRTFVDQEYKGPLVDIARKYRQADELSAGRSRADQIGARFAQFSRITVITDFDGTITQDPEVYLNYIPGSTHAEALLEKHGRHAFPWVYPLTWQQPLAKMPTAFQGEDAPVEFTEGVKDFFHYASEQKIPITVLSANFEPFVSHQLSKITSSDPVKIYAVTDKSILPTAKDAFIKYIAASDPDAAVIYLGDGSSDEEAIQAAGVVALFGARRDKGFDKRLESHPDNIPYFRYDDFNKIKKVVEYAHGISSRSAS